MQKNLNSAGLNERQTLFKSARKICKENKLREFQFKFLLRIVITKKELFRYGIKQDSDCLFCDEEDSIDYTFINCQFTQSYRESVFRWFNSMNNSKCLPSLRESLFGLSENLPDNIHLAAKLNHTVIYEILHFILVNFTRKLLLSQTFPTK